MRSLLLVTFLVALISFLSVSSAAPAENVDAYVRSWADYAPEPFQLRKKWSRLEPSIRFFKRSGGY